MKDRPMSRKQHERLSTVYLVSIVSSYQENMILGRVDGDDVAGDLANDAESLFFNYFFDRRDEVPLRRPQPSMTFNEVLDIIADALDTISEERPDLLEVDYDGKFQLKEMRGQ